MAKMVLSPFQVEKLMYYFNFFDADKNGKLERADLPFITKRILDFTGWDPKSAQARKTAEIHEAFFEVLFEKADENTDCRKNEIDMDEWIHMWERLLPGSMGMASFPVWLRLLPDVLFKIIDRNEDKVIDEEELKMYYEKMCDVDSVTAKEQAKKAMEQMTDFGAYPLDLTSFEQVFANFLIGKTPYGPGRFLFALFSHQDAHFQILKSIPDEAKTSKRRGSGPIAQRPQIRLKAMT